MDLNLTDKVVVVTASSTGIGAACAALLAREGATAITSGRRPGGPDVGEVMHVSVDLLERDGPEKLIDVALKNFGRIDCLVNNFGHAEIKDFALTTDAEWEHAFTANFLSPVQTIRAVLPSMCERHEGAIVNVGSTAGRRPSRRMPQYSVTKAALHAVSRRIAKQYSRVGIRSNVVIPGPTVTPAWTGDGGLADQQGEREIVLDKAASERPMGRFAEPDEVAAAIAYLCSPQAKHITGVEWSVSGGSVQ